MSFVKLRTLTLKSTLGYGKHYDQTVSNLLKQYKGNYLVWSYYNLSNISFNDEVLSILGIDFKIAKPGINPDYFAQNAQRLGKALMKPSEGLIQNVLNKKFRQVIANEGAAAKEFFYSSKQRNRYYNQHGVNPANMKGGKTVR